MIHEKLIREEMKNKRSISPPRYVSPSFLIMKCESTGPRPGQARSFVNVEVAESDAESPAQL